VLIVFLNAGGGSWHPNRVAKRLPGAPHFETVWVVGLQGVEDGEYVYAVTQLDVSNGDAPTWTVRIDKNFASWKVQRLQ
jgi:hypothetical protein